MGVCAIFVHQNAPNSKHEAFRIETRELEHVTVLLIDSDFIKKTAISNRNRNPVKSDLWYEFPISRSPKYNGCCARSAFAVYSLVQTENIFTTT